MTHSTWGESPRASWGAFSGVGEDATAAAAKAKAEMDAAKKVLAQAKQAAADASSVGKDILAFFSSWSGGDITARHRTISGTKPSYGWLPGSDGGINQPSIGPGVVSPKGFIEALSAGAKFADADWAAFGFKRPVMPRPDGQAWNLLTGKWETPTEAGATYQLSPTAAKGAKAYPSISALQAAQTWINGWATAQGWTKVTDTVNQAIAAKNWANAAANPPSAGKAQGLWSMIQMLGSGPVTTARTAQLSITTGTLAGQPFPPIWALWVAQATQLLGQIPKEYWPQNAAKLAALTASVPGVTPPNPSTTPGSGGGGAGAAIGLLGLAWLAFRMFA